MCISLLDGSNVADMDSIFDNLGEPSDKFYEAMEVSGNAAKTFSEYTETLLCQTVLPTAGFNFNVKPINEKKVNNSLPAESSF